MPTFDFKFTVKASLAAVKEFHCDTSALKRLAPPPMIVWLHDVEPLAEGSTSKFTLWIGPLPLRWTAVHRNVSEYGFSDIQTVGPAKKWEHTHSFVPLSDGRTEIREHIEFEHNSGFWGVATWLLFAKPNLYFLFVYRMLSTRWFLRGCATSARSQSG